jgi:uncharacterized protein
MSEPARSDGDLRLGPLSEMLDPRVRRLWAIQILLATAAVAIAGAAALTALAMAGDPPVALLAILLGVLVAAGIAAALLAPPLAYRVLRFQVTPLGLAVQRGWITRSITIVPHARIQSVQTSADPLERALGLATVEVRTASSAVARLPGMDAGRVAGLRADLASLAGEGQAT